MATHSIARLMPTSRGRNQLEHASGTIPRRAKTNPIRASSAARRMSIGSVIVAPTPTAGPLIAAITGLVHSNTRSMKRPPPSRGTRRRSLALPRPVIERLAAARQVGAGAEPAAGAGDDHHPDLVVGVGAVERLDQLARPSSRVQALSRSGRLRVIVSTPSSTA